MKLTVIDILLILFIVVVVTFLLWSFGYLELLAVIIKTPFHLN